VAGLLGRHELRRHLAKERDRLGGYVSSFSASLPKTVEPILRFALGLEKLDAAIRHWSSSLPVFLAGNVRHLLRIGHATSPCDRRQRSSESGAPSIPGSALRHAPIARHCSSA